MLVGCVWYTLPSIDLEGEDLCDLADALSAPLAEQQAHADSHKLRVSHKAEQHARLVVGMDPSRRHDTLYHGGLPDVTYVHGGLEPGMDGC